jgi:hypothetical protein
MAAEKKTDKDKLPRPEKEEKKNTSADETRDRAKEQKLTSKNRRVNYIIKDLPIY